MKEILFPDGNSPLKFKNSKKFVEDIKKFSNSPSFPPVKTTTKIEVSYPNSPKQEIYHLTQVITSDMENNH